MTNVEAVEGLSARLWREPERRRLVRLCAVISGDREAAEDLAQETLLEAWRNAHKLRDPAGADRWLAAIARNVCRRWARRRGREAALADLPATVDAAPDGLDVEVELERGELVELLDRALALLPAGTREVLIQRYVHDSPHAEIGARLGLSEDAVSMRLTRGKVVLRRMLASELGEETAGHGLAGAPGDWRETRVWCADCGRQRLLTRREAGAVAFRCPGCIPDASRLGTELQLGNPFFARLVGELVRPAAMFTRVAEWSHRYYAGGAGGEEIACTRCSGPVRLRTYLREGVGPMGADSRGLFAECGACGETVSSSLRALARAVPDVRRFRRAHPRTRALPEREVHLDGLPAVVVRYEDLRGRAGVEVFVARDTLRVLAVHGATD